jgi:hypothetical protein
MEKKKKKKTGKEIWFSQISVKMLVLTKEDVFLNTNLKLQEVEKVTAVIVTLQSDM